MKKDTHPEYKEVTITCACGNVVHTRSTKKNIRVDICANCHPFFTGEKKYVDSAGRIERFKQRYSK
ncbi:MAG: 50S ribosomal protein L31 [Candidatus Omnitrophota bacterium]